MLNLFFRLVLFAAIFGGLIACSANHSPAPAPETTPVASGQPAHQNAATPLNGLIQFPYDAPLNPAIIAQRRSSQITTISQYGDAAWQIGAASSVNHINQTLHIGNSTDMAWSIYRFPDLQSADNPDLLTVNLESDNLPATLWLGVANFTANTWMWTRIDTPVAVNNIALDTSTNTISPGSNCYFAIVLTGSDSTTVNRVQLRLDYHAVPPTNVKASTNLPAEVKVSWDPPVAEPITAFRVERALAADGPWTQIAEVQFGTSLYDDVYSPVDNPIAEDTPLYYRISSLIGTTSGYPSLIAKGSRISEDPVAALSANLTAGPTPLTVTIDASGSSDPDGGAIVDYKWDFDGDGTYDFDSGTTAALQHEFDDVRFYSTTVQVTDDEGKTNTATVSIQATDPYGSWYHTYGRDLTRSEHFTDVAADSSGSIFAVGSKNPSWIGKFDSSGNRIWMKETALSDVSFERICRDPAGNLYVAGNYNGGSNDNRVYLAKLDDAGELLWSKRLDQGSTFEGLAIGSSRLYVFADYGGGVHGIVKFSFSGIVQDSLFWDNVQFGDLVELSDGSIICTGLTPQATTSYKDAALMRLDSSDNVSWCYSIGGSYSDALTRITMCPDGNLCAAGWTDSWGTAELDNFSEKWQPDGILLWTSVMGTADLDQDYAIAALPSGDIVVAGYATHSAGVGSLIIWDSAGNNVLAKEWSNTSQLSQKFSGMCVSSEGNLLIAGDARNVLAGDPAQPTWAWDDVPDVTFSNPTPAVGNLTPNKVPQDVIASAYSQELLEEGKLVLDVGAGSSDGLLINLNPQSIK